MPLKVGNCIGKSLPQVVSSATTPPDFTEGKTLHLRALVAEIPTYFPNLRSVRILGNTFGYHMLQKRGWVESLAALLNGVKGIRECSFTMSLQGYTEEQPPEPDPTVLKQREEEYTTLITELQTRLEEGERRRLLEFSYETCPPIGLWDRPNLPFHPLVWM